MSEDDAIEITRQIPLPAGWYMGAHGDPVAVFESIVLELHPDGSVTWKRLS